MNMALLLRSSSSQTARRSYLRKNRKWPLSPYKTKWHETFCQQQGMGALKKAAAAASTPAETDLLSALAHSFSQYGCDPTPSAYHFVIQTLARTAQLNHIPRLLHRLRFIETFETPEPLFVDLIGIYARAGKLREAADVFFGIPNFRCAPSVASLDALLSVLCRTRSGLLLVPEVVSRVGGMNIRIEDSSLRILISALCRIGKPGHAIEVLGYMLEDGNCWDAESCSLILSSLCAQQNSQSHGVDVLGFLDDMRRRGGFVPGREVYCDVIRSLVGESRGMEAFHVLNWMKLDGIKPDIACYSAVLSGVVGAGDYHKAEELFDEILVWGLVPDVHTYNAYIRGLCARNDLESGLKMLSCMQDLQCKPDSITYNVLLEALCGAGEVSRAKELAREMGLKGVQKDSQTYRIMFGGLVSKREISEACALLRDMLDQHLVPQSWMVDDIICGFCEKGLVGETTEWLSTLLDGKNVLPGTKGWEILVVNLRFNLSSVQSSVTDLVNSLQSQLVRLPQS